MFCVALGTEFIHLISSEANEICEKESKKTIAPEHIIGALKVCLLQLQSHRDNLCDGTSNVQQLGFDKFKDEVEDVLKDHKQLQKVRYYILPNCRLMTAHPSNTAHT